MRKAAKELGYAITVHGSMKRDFDIVVVPWTDQAASTYDVAHAIRNTAGSDRWRCPDNKDSAPHSREWWPFDWKDSSHKNKDYVDMSIIPPQTEYGKYEFCKYMNCGYLKKSKCELKPGCCHSARGFHGWLKENGFKIVKNR